MSVPGGMPLSSASDRCVSLGAQLATAGQLLLAWRSGLEVCSPGWLSDGSVRSPPPQPGQDCPGSQGGVHVPDDDAAGRGNDAELYDAYCYRGEGTGVVAVETGEVAAPTGEVAVPTGEVAVPTVTL